MTTPDAEKAEPKKLTEVEQLKMENLYLRLVAAQQAYDLAGATLEARDRARREANNELIAFRTTLEAKYQTSLAPGTNLRPDGTIVPSAPVAAATPRPLTPQDFPLPEPTQHETASA